VFMVALRGEHFGEAGGVPRAARKGLLVLRLGFARPEKGALRATAGAGIVPGPWSGTLISKRTATFNHARSPNAHPIFYHDS
jgi:hypothetical protein